MTVQHEQKPRTGVVFQRMQLPLGISETKRNGGLSEPGHAESVSRVGVPKNLVVGCQTLSTRRSIFTSMRSWFCL